jgi:hypothetical protein
VQKPGNTPRRDAKNQQGDGSQNNCQHGGIVVPLYEYRCPCGHQTEEWRTVKSRKTQAPKHCGKRMPIQITGKYSVWGAFQEYRAVGRGKPLIKTRQAHKDYLRINGYEEIGNDKSMAPPELHMSEAEIAYRTEQKRREEHEAISHIGNAPSF